jgi:protein-L-isoaspartate(D-aspartate) O-methyltransferase
MNNDDLIDVIRERAPYYIDGSRRDERVLFAMQNVDRKLFLTQGYRQYAYDDNPVPIGFGQTCSQPSMVAFMLDKLRIENGHRILEVGAGCGYAAAAASLLCGEGGIVYASEIIPELAAAMAENIASYKNIRILSEDGSAGFPGFAPFDRIFLSAGVSGSGFSESVLVDQLSDGGILLYPEDIGSIFVVSRNGDILSRVEYEGVRFVRLRGMNS